MHQHKHTHKHTHNNHNNSSSNNNSNNTTDILHKAALDDVPVGDVLLVHRAGIQVALVRAAERVAGGDLVILAAHEVRVGLLLLFFYY